MERSDELDAAVPSLDSECISAPDQQRLSEGIPPDQLRLRISAWDAEIVALEKQLSVAKAQRAVCVAEEALKNAQKELQVALTNSLNPSAPTDCKAVPEEDRKISLNPSAPTDCKVVHITKAMSRRARRRLRQLEVVLVMPEKSEDTRSEPDARPEKSEDTRSEKSEDTRSEKTLELEPESKEPEPETELRPVVKEMPKPPEGLVQQRIASFEVLAKAHDEQAPESNEALQPVVDKLEPDKALEPNDLLVSSKPSWADIASSSDDDCDDDCDEGLALAHASVDAETPAEALSAANMHHGSSPLGASNGVGAGARLEVEKFEPYKALEPDVRAGAPETSEGTESEAEATLGSPLPLGRWRRKGSAHHGSSPPNEVASNGVGDATLAQKIALGQLDDDAYLAIALQIVAEDAPT